MFSYFYGAKILVLFSNYKHLAVIFKKLCEMTIRGVKYLTKSYLYTIRVDLGGNKLLIKWE